MDSPGPRSSNAVNEGGSQQYKPHPSQVPISNFVSTTLELGCYGNYNVWKKQMMCLLEYHDMTCFIDGTPIPMNKSKDHTLVKGWILGTLSESATETVLDLDNAYEIWEKLKTSYDESQRVTDQEKVEKEDNFDDDDEEDYDDRQSGTEKRKVLPDAILNKKVTKAKYIPLHRAIERGDWDRAQQFFNKNIATLCAKISWEGETPLHLSIYKSHNLDFVENLINKIEKTSLPTLVNIYGYTTLHYAATVGNTDAAKMLVDKNPLLLFVANKDDELPLLTALRNYQEETFLYLLQETKLHIGVISQNDSCQNPFEGKQGSLLLCGAIGRGYLDIAYELICQYPKLAISNVDNNQTPLWSIVNNQDVYLSSTPYNSYQRFIYSYMTTGNNIVDNKNKDNMIPDIENPGTYSTTKFVTKCKSSYCYTVVPHIRRIREEKLKHSKGMMILERICEEICKMEDANQICEIVDGAFNTAVLNDIPEVIETIVGFLPHAIWTRNNNHYLPQVVARCRSEMVCRYLEVNARNDLFRGVYDMENNDNILHLAGKLAPISKLNLISGAALQMQKEEIEKFVLPSAKESRNSHGDTPIMVFREEHKDLRKEGEEWMKKTSDSYTITAALIITIVFASAITIPGGNDGNTGKPIYETNNSFIIFAVSDAISLFTSTTSLLLFLSILTSRYHEDDFLYKLPKRLIFGLVMLFISVTSMMLAFSATLYIMFGQGRAWIIIPIVALSCLPIATYVILQFPLLVELISSTYGHTIYPQRCRVNLDDYDSNGIPIMSHGIYAR
uniref:uncharacterized protein LOC122608792 n=1 Tax=Erigeron canadensis TaxID=72917 RepID=UPI001CB935BD|nr:uncharacterized protein LOC122608792 [Erigeron canadensis]